MSTAEGEAPAVEGRLPVLPAERLYSTYGSFFRTFTTFGASLWVFLIGSALPMVGNTKIGIVGYACGLILGYIPVLLSSGLPSYRYGIDTIDACKPALGQRGVIIPLLGLIINALGWAGVVVSMVARGGVLLVRQEQSVDEPGAAWGVIAISLLVIVVCWLLLRQGLNLVRRLNDFVGPALIVLATVSLILLVRQFGLHQLWNARVRPEDALTTDPRTSLAYAVEFGIVSSMSWWPYVGGLYRLLKYRRHAVSPPILGGTLIGGAYCSGIAALAAANCATADPVVWIISLAGKPLGTLVVALLLLMNIPTICMLIYFAAISIQQLRLLARVPWSVLVALLLAPLTLVAFHTLWTVNHVMTIATYCGVQFVVVSAIEIVDFYFLRRQTLAMDQVFSAGKHGRYWFWHGLNYVAIAIILISIAGYLLLYNPVTLATSAGFRYFGASIPIFVGSGALYYALTRLTTIPSGRGGYLKTSGALPHQPMTTVKL